MVKKLTQIAAIAAFVAPVFAQAQSQADLTVTFAEQIIDAQAEMPDSCRQVKLTDEQKVSLRNAYLDFNTQRKPLRKDVKKAMRDMKMVFASSTSTRDDATAAQTNVKDKFAALGTVIGDFQLKVFFDILMPEQRAPAMRCLQDLK